MTSHHYIEASSDSEHELKNPWVLYFCHKRGNEYFSVVDEDFILDRFNLTGLGHDIPHAQGAYELVAGNDDFDELSAEHAEEIRSSAKLLYGMIHARFIITPNGLSRMKKKFLAGEFGICPRVLCNEQSLIPVGLSDVPRVSTVKLYCCHCEDIYNPKSSAHNAVDGAFFGTTFAHLFFQAYSSLRPSQSNKIYTPKIFGFRIAGSKALARLQRDMRNKEQEDDNEESSSEEEEDQTVKADDNSMSINA